MWITHFSDADKRTGLPSIGYKLSGCLDLTGTAGDAVKTELRPQQPTCVIGVGGTYLSLHDLAASIDTHAHTGLESLHASI